MPGQPPTPRARGLVRLLAVLSGAVLLACGLSLTGSMGAPSGADPVAVTSMAGHTADVAGLSSPMAGCRSGCGLHRCAAVPTGPVAAPGCAAPGVVVSRRAGEGGPVPAPSGYAATVRGAPPWAVLSRSQLSVIRV